MSSWSLRRAAMCRVALLSCLSVLTFGAVAQVAAPPTDAAIEPGDPIYDAPQAATQPVVAVVADDAPVTLVKGQPYLVAAGRSPIPMEGETLSALIPAKQLGEDAPRPVAPDGPVAWGAAYNFVGQEITVTGTIVDTHNHKGTLCFLNFDKEWQGKFYITVFKSAFENIPGGAAPEDYFLGKKLEITGKVTVNKGRPNIEVRKLSAIKIVQ